MARKKGGIDNVQMCVLEHYGLFLRGEMRMEDSLNGVQPLMEPDTLNRLLSLDPTEDHAWTDWIFLHAGVAQAPFRRILSEKRWHGCATT